MGGPSGPSWANGAISVFWVLDEERQGKEDDLAVGQNLRYHFFSRTLCSGERLPAQ